MGVLMLLGKRECALGVFKFNYCQEQLNCKLEYTGFILLK